MNKFIRHSIFTIATGITLLSVSCTPESCFEKTESFLKATLYNYTTQRIQTADSLSLWGLNKESAKILNKSLKVQSVQFPLNSATGKSVFIIRINGIIDTLELSYSSYPHLVTKECGYTFYHNIESANYSKKIIDSVSVTKSNITTLNEENIRIYY